MAEPMSDQEYIARLEAEVERLNRELDRVTRGTYSLELARLSKKCGDLAAALAAEKGDS